MNYLYWWDWFQEQVQLHILDELTQSLGQSHILEAFLLILMFHRSENRGWEDVKTLLKMTQALRGRSEFEPDFKSWASHLPQCNESTRTGYVIFGIQSKMKVLDTCTKVLRVSRWRLQSVNWAPDPSGCRVFMGLLGLPRDEACLHPPES